jgi:hypothetical protein
MQPVGLVHSGAKGWQIAHRCTRCGAQGRNRVAADTEQPDDVRAVARLSGLESRRVPP